MNQNRRKFINDLAETIQHLLKCNIPINLNELVLQLEGNIIEKDVLERDIESKLTSYSEINNSYNFQIEILKNKPEEHKRFSISHEIGHLFLHMGYLTDKKNGKIIS